jgi:hypothetical protein
MNRQQTYWGPSSFNVGQMRGMLVNDISLSLKSDTLLNNVKKYPRERSGKV